MQSSIEQLMLDPIVGALLVASGIVFALYVVLVRPQLGRLADHLAFVESLKVGDYIVTGGGLIGQIVRCDEAVVTVSLGDGVTVDAVRSTISSFAPARYGASAQV